MYVTMVVCTNPDFLGLSLFGIQVGENRIRPISCSKEPNLTPFETGEDTENDFLRGLPGLKESGCVDWCSGKQWMKTWHFPIIPIPGGGWENSPDEILVEEEVAAAAENKVLLVQFVALATMLASSQIFRVIQEQVQKWTT